MIDHIEYNVTQTAEYVGKATEDVKKASKYQKEARKVNYESILFTVFVQKFFVFRNQHTKIGG